MRCVVTAIFLNRWFKIKFVLWYIYGEITDSNVIAIVLNELAKTCHQTVKELQNHLTVVWQENCLVIVMWCKVCLQKPQNADHMTLPRGCHAAVTWHWCASTEKEWSKAFKNIFMEPRNNNIQKNLFILPIQLVYIMTWPLRKVIFESK